MKVYHYDDLIPAPSPTTARSLTALQLANTSILERSVIMPAWMKFYRDKPDDVTTEEWLRACTEVELARWAVL